MQNLLANTIHWNKVFLVLAIIVSIAIIFSILILLVTKYCKIQEDEKVVKILENLAGANCGGCGHSGCSGFAEALSCGKACLKDCNATSPEAKQKIAEILGLPYADEEPTVAVVKCNGGENSADKYVYVGYEGCINQKVLHGVKKVCATACLGGKTCESVCPYNAIKVVNGVAKVDKRLCVSCGACINKCPQLVIERIPLSAPVYCACSTHCKGKETTSFCKVGCIGCGLCVKACPNGAIRLENNLPVFDYSKCAGCLECVKKCPRKIIKEH